MARKKPQKHTSHENSKIARRNLEDAFGNWNIYPVGEVNSGLEYGQDWIVEIVEDNGDVTGMDFRVQSKVLSSKKAKTKDGHIREYFKVSTLNYLFDLPSPVLLHFVYKPTGKGYVMWLGPWYVVNSPLKEDGKVAVKIPLTEELDHQRVESIKKTVANHHAKQYLQKYAELTNANNPDISVSLTFGDKTIKTLVEPKHDAAIPVIDLLDSKADKSFRQAMETGEPTPSEGVFDIRGVPSIFVEPLKGFELKTIRIWMDNISAFLMTIQYFDEEGKIVHQTKLVDMQPVQSGSVFKRWEGKITDRPIIFSFGLNMKTHENILDYKLDTKERDPVQVNRVFEYFDELENAVRFKVIEARSDRQIVEGKINPKTTNSPKFKILKRLTNAILIINDKTNSQLNIPEQFNNDDFGRAELISTVLETGIYRGLLFSPKEEFASMDLETYQEAREILSLLDNRNAEYTILHRHDTPPIVIKLWGIEFTLGEYEYILPNVRLANRIDAEKAITISTEDDAQKIQIYFAFDRDQAYTRFPQWLPKKRNDSDEEFDLAEDFRESWHEAMTGNTVLLRSVLKRTSED